MAFGGRYGFEVHPVAPLRMDEEVVARLNSASDFGGRSAQRPIGFGRRPYSIDGVVLHGAKRGTDLGWPTANLRLPAERVTPPDGVLRPR
ncbi:MAG: riboflavin kinase [Nitrospiraceae bacterium]